MTRRSTPVNERLLEDPAGLIVQPPAPTNRLVEDGAGLVVSRPVEQRMIEQGAGLLVTPPAALTAAPGEDDAEDRSPDPWQEQRAAAAADLARWETRLEAGARKALAAWTAIAATAVLEDRYLTAAPGDGSMLPPDPNAIPALGPTWSKIANTHIVRLVSELLGEVFARFLRDDEVISSRPWQDAYLDEVSNRLVSVADSTFDLVRGVVQDGIDEGASIPDIRDRVQESLDAGGETSWAHRARTIARTETIGAYNGGHLAAWSAVEELTGDPVDKVWLATIDPRTRDSHFRADGQRVSLGEPFRVGGHDLAFPGDPTAPAEEVINCRCTMLELDPSDPLPDVSERGFRDADEVAGEIARRADADPPVVRAFDDPEASLQAAAAASSTRPAADVVARMDAIFRASYEDRLDPLLTDEAVVDPAVVSAILDAAAAGGSGARPAEAHVARMDAIYRASYATTDDPLLTDDEQVDPALLAAELGRALTAAGLGGLARGDAFDPNQKRDENGKWTKHGVGISIKVKDAPDERASFAEPTEALARVTFEHDLRGSDGKAYSTHVTNIATAKHDGALVASIEFRNDAGRVVGRAARHLQQTDDGPAVKHHTLKLEKAAQGLGLASEFNQKAEAVYRAGGVTHIVTEAHSNSVHGMVGGYVWARRGFDWADETGPKRAATRLRQLTPKALLAEQPEVLDMIERLQTGPLEDRPTPWDVSELRGFVRDSEDNRLGRAALLETIWNGVRWLPADDRADAEPDPAPAPLPAVKLPDGASFTTPDEALLRATYEHELTGSDGNTYRSKVRSVDLRSGTADVVIALEDSTGRRVGISERTIRQVEDGPQAYHGSLVLNEKYQGLGLGSQFNQHAEAAYRAGGVTHVALSATSNPATGYVGGYVWARRGFDWAPPGGGAKNVAKELRRFSPKHENPHIDAVIERLEAGAASGDVSGMPTPFEVSELRGKASLLEPDAPLGKRALLKSTWEGVRWLPTADEATAPEPDVAVPDAPDPNVEPLAGAAVDASLVELARSAPPAEDWDAEFDALADYRSLGYIVMNGHLRGQDYDWVSGDPINPTPIDLENIAELRAIADRHRLTQPVEVYRGMRNVDAFLPKKGQALGTVITDPGFLSTTVDAGVAERFGDTNDSAVMRLIVPAGHPVIPMDALSGGDGDAPDEIADERELVLPPGASLRIVADGVDRRGVRQLTAEVLPYGGEEATAAVEAAVPAAVPPSPKAPRKKAAADGAKLTPSQEKALGWIAADPGDRDAGGLPRTDVLRRLNDAGLITDPPDGWRWDRVEVTPAGRAALGLPEASVDPEPDEPVAEPVRGGLADADLADLAHAGGPATGPERLALESYRGEDYRAMNAHLRGLMTTPLPEETAQHLDVLRGLADRHRLTWPVEVYRGVMTPDAILPPRGQAVGTVITDPGFMSTATAHDVATDFAIGPKSALFRITVPEGHPVIPMDGLIGVSDAEVETGGEEHELVLPPGSALRITGEETDATGRRVIVATVLPYSAPADTPAAAPAASAALSGADADRMLSALVTEDLEPDADMALQSYITSGYRSLNDHLRGVDVADPAKGGVHRDVLNEIEALSGAADAYRLTAPIEAWRGLYAVDRFLPPRGEAVGTVVTDPGFMSVSIDPAVAGNFGHGETAALFRLTVPEGHPVLPVDQLFAGVGGELSPDEEREFEVILPPGSSLRITGETEDPDGRRVITAEVLPYAGGSQPAGDGPAAAPDVDAPAVEEPATPARSFKVLGTPLEGDEFLRATFDPKALSKPQKEALGFWTNGTNYRQVNELLRTGSLDVKVMTYRGKFEPNPAGGLTRLEAPVYETHTVHSPDDIRAVAALADGGAAQAPSLTRLADQLDNLPTAIDRHQLPEDMSLFRVAALPELAHADPASLVGRTISDRGYVATSTSEKSAVLVTAEALGVAADDAVLFEIRTPAGTPFATPEIKLGTVNGQKLGGYTRVQEVLLHPSSFRVVEVRDEEVSTDGYSLKNGALVTRDAKAKRPATKVRRIVVELVDPADAAVPAPTVVPAADVVPAVDAPNIDAPEAPTTPAADAPAVEAPAPAAAVAGGAPGTAPIKLTAARVGALEYYAVPLGERSGKSPNYSVYMPLLAAGLIERDANGKYVATDAGRAALAGAPDVPAGAEAGVPGLAPDLPADVPPLTGEAAYASLPRLSSGGSAEDYVARTALGNYQGAGYAVVNQHLRGGEVARPDDAEALAAQLDGIFATIEPLGHPITVYRGSGSATTIFGDQPMEPGTVITDRAYLSTSTDPAVAGKFIGLTSDPAVLEIDVPAGARTVAVEGNEGYEAEALLPRGTSLRVVSDTVERTVTFQEGYDRLAETAKRAGWPDGELDRVARQSKLVVDARRIRAEVVLADDRRDATPDRPAEAAPAASRPSAAPDSPADSADPGDGAAAALAAEQAAAEAKAEKKRAAAAKRAEKKRAKEEADRAAALEAANDSSGVPMKLSYDYLSSLSDEEREDVEVHLIEQLTAGDPMAEGRLDDLALFNQAQVAEQEIAEQEDRLGTLGVSEEITAWHERNGRPGLTHPLVGGSGATGDVLGVPSMKQVQEEYRQFVYEQWLKAEEATNGYMVTPRGVRLGKTGLDMFSSHRGVADVMQYASEELLNWFEENRRIAWAEFYYERTRSSGYAEKAAAAKAVSLQINRDRTALKASAGLPTTVALVAAARRAPAAPVEPTEAQLDAYAAGRAAATAGEPATVCPFAPSKDAKDHHGLFTLWVRGYVVGTVAAFTARRVAEGLLPDPTLDRLGWGEGDVAVLEPTAHAGDPADRLLALEGELVMGAAGVALTASARLSGHTVTAAGSGPGDSSATEGRPPMPRTWVSAPHLAPFGVPTGDGRIFKVGSLTNRELPLPLLFQPSSGMGHDGSVVVGRILAVEFTEAGIVASGDYLDADPDKAPDLSKAIEQAVALTESGLGHVSVDLSDVVGELVDEDGNPVEMEDIFDAWDRGEDPKVLEQISEGKLIAVTQVATPAFEGAKIELSAAAAVDVDAEAALTDEAGAAIAVGAVVDVETDEGAIRGEVTAVDEESETVTVQPTDDDGAPAGDPLEVAPAAITVVTPAADEAPDAEDAAAEQVASLVAAAGPLRPPAAWFEDPKLPGPTAMTITDDGRIYGHVAVWGACHVGFSNTCVTPPESPSSYKHFHVGEVVTEDGSRVAVGNLTLGGRHADVRLAYRSAIEHYDVSGAGVGVVRCYEDEYGIAFAGALTPGTTEEQIYDMRRSPVSGDWRRVGGELEMIGVLSVNAGGFNTPRFATDEAGRTALVAAPSVRPMDEEAIVAAAGGGRRSTGVLSQRELIARITRDATAAVRRELAEESSRAERNRRLAGLAVSIKADPRSRLQRLAATVDAPKRQARASRLAELADLVGSR